VRQCWSKTPSHTSRSERLTEARPAESHAVGNESAMRKCPIPNNKINWLSAVNMFRHVQNVLNPCQKYCPYAMCLAIRGHKSVCSLWTMLNGCLYSYWMNSSCAQKGYLRSVFPSQCCASRTSRLQWIAMQTIGVAFREFPKVTRTFGHRRPLLK